MFASIARRTTTFSGLANTINRVAQRNASAAAVAGSQDSGASAYTGGFDVFDQGRKILVTGGNGQLGVELVPYLREIYGKEAIVNSDIRLGGMSHDDGPFVYLDVQNKDQLARIVLEHGIDTIVHMASILSALGEKNPSLALKVNTRGIENVLECAKVNELKVFSPSSIAAFGPNTPREFTPDVTTMDPTTMYGITKLHLELLGAYYNRVFGVDFRSIRYPGVISSEAWPGGGTTDYAVEIYYEALLKGKYKCFLSKDTKLPMMFMPDTLKATADLMQANDDNLSLRTYNVTAISFTPEQLAESIRKFIPDFEISYEPDFRQEIADTWPKALDDTRAQNDWGWTPEYDLDRMTEAMLERLTEKLKAAGKL